MCLIPLTIDCFLKILCIALGKERKMAFWGTVIVWRGGVDMRFNKFLGTLHYSFPHQNRKTDVFVAVLKEYGGLKYCISLLFLSLKS